ncbi:MAG: biopolymer transporter ExbD [Gammaproteobacteria bacterium]|nr:biopolymer transporter ExbD [Gammaproteobacteria bacterium]
MSDLGRISLSMGGRRKHPIKITFVPLVDCFIILLIFFMLQSTFVIPHGVELSNSKKEENKPVGTTTEESTLIFVELHKDGTYWLDGEQLAFKDLPNRLPRARGTAKPVVIASDPGVPLQRAVDVIDTLNDRGYTKISLREAQQFKS